MICSIGISLVRATQAGTRHMHRACPAGCMLAPPTHTKGTHTQPLPLTLGGRPPWEARIRVVVVQEKHQVPALVALCRLPFSADRGVSALSVGT